MGQIKSNQQLIGLYGLLGYPLTHSFSQKYFTEKFAREGREGCLYRNFPITDIGLLRQFLSQQPDLYGFNVTIPYKEQMVPLMDELDVLAAKVGAVNTVQVLRNGTNIHLKGYNTDVYGFSQSLKEWVTLCNTALPRQALVLGTGGASKAVICALSDFDIVTRLVSRQEGKGIYKTYNQIGADDIASHLLIVNATPLGMFPNTDECPAIPYQYLTEKHYLYDLVYNPEETLFMRKGIERGASVYNGERMLHLQADKAWEIWNNYKL